MWSWLAEAEWQLPPLNQTFALTWPQSSPLPLTPTPRLQTSGHSFPACAMVPYIQATSIICVACLTPEGTWVCVSKGPPWLADGTRWSYWGERSKYLTFCYCVWSPSSLMFIFMFYSTLNTLTQWPWLYSRNEFHMHLLEVLLRTFFWWGPETEMFEDHCSSRPIVQ